MQKFGRGRRTGRSTGALAALAAVTLLIAGCGVTTTAPDPDAAPPTQKAPVSAETPTPTPEPELTLDDIVAAVADADWSFADGGLGEPHTVTVVAGTATDDVGRTYTVGDAVAGDANGDGIVDAAIPIAQLDGNALHELWYIWLGTAVGTPPEQVIYPISRTTRCGDVTAGVTGVDGGFEVDVVLRMPFTDDHRSCAEAGTGALTRTIGVSEVEGEWFPVQSAPVAAWGGVCPPSPWLDGSAETGIPGRAAPPASAPLVIDPEREVGVFWLGDAPLVTSGGVSFFGFIQEDVDAPVKMHCAFADGAA